MKILKITHFYDVIKKESDFEPEIATPISNNGNNLNTNVKAECYIKEEVDILWDEISNNVDRGHDDMHASEKYAKMFNARVIINKLPDSIIQKYSRSERNLIENHEYNIREKGTGVDEEKFTEEADTDLRNTSRSRKSGLKKTYDNHENKLYLKVCKKCDKREEIVFRKHKMHDCKECKTRLIYECKKCRWQCVTLLGIKQHLRAKCFSKGYYFKCFECDYKAANKTAVGSHVMKRHPTMTSQMYSRFEKIESENVQKDLDKTKHQCSKCGKKFVFLSKLLRHQLICTGSQATDDDENQSVLDKLRESIRKLIILYCRECDKEVPYSKMLHSKVREGKKMCLHCKSIMTFKCLECKRQFTSRHGISGHIRGCHVDRQAFKCSECDYTTGRVENMSIHYNGVHAPGIRECSNCDKKFYSHSRFYNHSRRCGMPPRYNCEHCSYQTHYRSAMKQHLFRRHSIQNRIECPICKVTYKNENTLSVHRLTCGMSPKHQCDLCSYKSKYKALLKLHILRMHTTLNQIECPICKKMTKNELSLKGHLRFCKVKDYLKCQFCSFKTKTRNTLVRHTLRFHADENINNGNATRNYECDHCSYKCKLKTSMYEHIVKHHLKEKNIKCSKCGEKFQNHVYLQKHLAYCGLTPHLQCEHCSFQTYLKGNLNAHIKVKHLTFECTACKFMVKGWDNLRHHKKRHCKKQLD